MRLNLFVCLLTLAVAAGCKNANDKENTEAENDLDAARNFVQAALKGRYDVAKTYMLQDSANMERLDAVSRMKLSSDEKQGLWDASINIHNRKIVNDSVSIIIFSNSFHKENTDTLKVVKQGGTWRVDFKYLFDHPTEVITAQPAKDSTSK